MNRTFVPLAFFFVCASALASAVERIPQWILRYSQTSCIADLTVYHQTQKTPMVSFRYKRAFDDSPPMIWEKHGLILGRAALHVGVHYDAGQQPSPPYSVLISHLGEYLTPTAIGKTNNGTKVSEFFVFTERHAERVWKELATPGRVELLLNFGNGDGINYSLKVRNSAQAAAMILACASVKEEDRG